jgi:nucleotide-binding universal stress UspA family protein
MDKIKIILAPTDLSEPSQTAVRYALNLARTLGAEVTVYHVVNNEELVNYFEELEEGEITDITFRQANRLLKSYQLALARFLNEHFSDLIPWVRIREKVELGVPEKSIVEWAEKEGSDLIVISFHERSDQTQASVGIVAEKIVRNAPCPVLSVHSRLEEKSSQKAAAVA